ncbi:MAG: hypothetical protein PHI49_09545 [Halothiobacillaceae bacterium]|nr:hypothetical protein [Halothiobacillaceae bacterium]
MSPWAGMALVLGLLAASFAGVALWRHLAQPHPELPRKLMHVLMGLVAAGFPWLFDSVWPVLVLAAASMIALWLVRAGRAGTAGLQGVLHGVGRVSWGELLFPAGVAAVFVLADGNALLYSVPILILALADALAALIGLRYGQMRFTTLDGQKSLEGSIAFFVVTFLCVHVALLLFTDTGRAESLLIGLILGLLVMMFEAIAWRGLDNLFIPLAAHALLQSYLGLDAAALLGQLGLVALLVLFVVFWRRRSTLDDGALIGAVLMAYASLAIGGWPWLAVMLLAFVVATVLALRDGAPERNLHNLVALLALGGPGLFWLLLHTRGETEAAFVAYAISFGAQLTMLGVSRAHAGRSQTGWRDLLPALGSGWAIVALPLLVFQVVHPVVALLAGLSVVLAGYAFQCVQPGLAACPTDAARWTRQAGIATGVSLLGWSVMRLI